MGGNPEDYKTLPREPPECIPAADIRTIDHPKQQSGSDPLRKIREFCIYYAYLHTVVPDIPQFLYLPGELSRAQSKDG